MPLVTTASIVTAARAAGRGACAFNVITVEHAEAVVTGAEAAGLPAILSISQNAVRFHGGRLAPIAAATAAVAAGAGVPVSLHLDHVTDAALLSLTAEAGFSSVMYDASALPYADNVAATRAAVEWAHGRDLWLEAELGAVGGKPGEPVDPHAPTARTDPEEAREYVRATGVDALAVAVGSRHAMTERTGALDQTLVVRLRQAVPVPLVLHGGSGVSDEELRAAVGHGIVKVNVGTALNVAFTGAVRDRLAADPAVVDPRAYLAEARTAVAATVTTLLELTAT